LRNICVQHLDLSKSMILEIERNTITGFGNNSCLVYVDISDNHITSALFVVGEWSKLRSVQAFNMCCQAESNAQRLQSTYTAQTENITFTWPPKY
jgi:hypothetical protein